MTVASYSSNAKFATTTHFDFAPSVSSMSTAEPFDHKPLPLSAVRYNLRAIAAFGIFGECFADGGTDSCKCHIRRCVHKLIISAT